MPVRGATAHGQGRDEGVSGRPAYRLSRWVNVAPDGTVTIRTGKVELGQGIVTALAQLAADELDIDLADVRMQPASTAESPDEGVTAGSMSIAQSGAALRSICAEVRALFLAAAVEAVGLDPATATIRAGVFSDARGRASTTYGRLADAVDLDREAEGTVRPKTPVELRIAGTSAPRLDLPRKVTGRPAFIHDLLLPGQLYGRVVRPPSPAATLAEVDVASVRTLAGVVAVVHDGSFLGVVAESEERAERAASALRAASRWHEDDTLPDEDDLPRYLRTVPVEIVTVAETGSFSESDRSSDEPVATASYSRPFLAHASMAPSCAAAVWAGEKLTVWSHSQGIHALGRAIAQALDLAADAVVVHHVQGAGCYGHNAADDAAFDAVLLARAVPGRPVHVRWSRADELTWSPFGSAMAVDVAARLSPDGQVAEWSYDVWSQGHLARPGYAGSPGLLAMAHLEGALPLPVPIDPSPEHGAGIARGAVPIYSFAACRIHSHRALSAPLRTSALRSLGAFMNAFAIESFMDELALRVERDPLEFRLAHLNDARAQAVLKAATELAGWNGRAARAREHDGLGLGIGFARYKGTGAYCAVVAEVEAVSAVVLRRLYIAVDVGQIVNPDGVRNQIEGGAVQAASWTLKERVRFDRRRVTSSGWDTYPILRFSETPEVAVTLLSRPDEPSVGAGEAAQGPTAAAIANAVADAIGVRVRDLPLTTERVIAAMDS